MSGTDGKDGGGAIADSSGGGGSATSTAYAAVPQSSPPVEPRTKSTSPTNGTVTKIETANTKGVAGCSGISSKRATRSTDESSAAATTAAATATAAATVTATATAAAAGQGGGHSGNGGGPRRNRSGSHGHSHHNHHYHGHRHGNKGHSNSHQNGGRHHHHHNSHHGGRKRTSSSGSAMSSGSHNHQHGGMTGSVGATATAAAAAAATSAISPDAKSWFSSLATGSERCHASAIADPVFVRMFVDLASRDAGQSEADTKIGDGENDNTEEEAGVVRHSIEELTKLYGRYRDGSTDGVTAGGGRANASATGTTSSAATSSRPAKSASKTSKTSNGATEGQGNTATATTTATTTANCDTTTSTTTKIDGGDTQKEKEEEVVVSDAFRIRGQGGNEGDAAAEDEKTEKTDNKTKKEEDDALRLRAEKQQRKTEEKEKEKTNKERESDGNAATTVTGASVSTPNIKTAPMPGVGSSSGGGSSSSSSSTSPRVTLHFNSGLSLPVITTTNTAATTKAVLAAAERTRNSPTSSGSTGTGAGADKSTADPADADAPTTAEDDGDVGSTPSFSALGSPLSAAGAASVVSIKKGSSSPTGGGSGGAAAVSEGAGAAQPSPTGEGGSKSRKKKTKRQRQAANKIIQAKRAAARALGKQAATAGDVLLSHVRVVTPSSLGYFAAASSSLASDGNKDITGPILIIDPEVLASPRMFFELASKVVQTSSADGAFLSSSDWVERVAKSDLISAPVLLLAKMEEAIRAAHSAATLAGGLSSSSPDHSAIKTTGSSGGSMAASTSSLASSPAFRSASDHTKGIGIILSCGSPDVGAQACLRKLLNLWQWIRRNESCEAVTMLTSKVHNVVVENQCIGPRKFRLEDLFATPLGLLLGASQSTKDASVLDKWDDSASIVLSNVKVELDDVHPVGGGKKSTIQGKGVNAMTADEKAVETADGAAAGGAGGVSKPKKKKKKKKGKKKGATGPSAASAATGGAAILGSVPTGKNCQADATENAANVQNTLNALSPDNTRAKSTASRDSATSSAASHAASAVATCMSASLDDPPSIQEAPSADLSRSSADSLPQEPVKVRSATRSASIRIDSGNNMVVGLGRMMEEEEHHDDGWETVPAKGSEKRNNNARTGNGSSGTDERQGGTGDGEKSHHQQQPQSPGKKKKNRAREREKSRNKRFIKEVVSNILDGVEEEVEHRRQSAERIVKEKTKQSSDTKRPPSGARSKAASLRDVVLGPTGRQQQQSVDRTSSMPNVVNGEDRGRKKTTSKKSIGGVSSGRHAVAGIIPSGGIGNTEKASADQKTAPTVPDTVSARSSGVTGGRTTATDTAQATAAGIESPASTLGTAEPVKAVARTEQTPKDSSPPLPTLLGATNTISASSSVASSLEAPHATRHRPRGRSHELKEDDVGYHLVNLCDKLSDEMAVFMERRVMALGIRRNERAALLGALQESVTKIFSGHCRVEMYGSCATQLDLPSSDLDVVICGLSELDQSQHGPPQQLGGKAQKDQSQKDKRKESMDKDGTGSESNGLKEAVAQDNSSAQPHVAKPQEQQEQQRHQQYVPQYYQYYPPPSPNGARVLRLAAELEMQPWAVQVKAIPTATVPVIKLLADPTRAPGGGLDWMVQPQHMANVSMSAQEANIHHQEPPSRPHPQQPSALPQAPPGEVSDGPAPQSQPQQGYYNGPVPGTAQMPFIHPAAMPWRGADIMNGLISIDITFEGPEHGGIGSTIFSASFVQDVCNEAGLPPDATAAVQMIMVVKELLAQRRLNEPYSGGLSSFAVLLLAFSVIQERKLIQEEMQRIEKQRRAVEGSASVPKTKRGGRGKGKGKSNKGRPLKAESKPPVPASGIPPLERVESTKAEGPLSVTSSSTPVATGQAKSQSKQTQTDEDSPAVPPAPSDHSAKKAAAMPEPTKAPEKGSTKAPFSFKDALQSAPKPKNVPAPAAAHPKKEESGPETKSDDSDPPPAPERVPAATSAPKSWASIAKKKTEPPAVAPARTGPANGPKKEETSASNVQKAQKPDKSQGQVPVQVPVAAPLEDDTKKPSVEDGKKNADTAKPPAPTPLSSASTPRVDSDADEEADAAKPQAASTISLASASASTPAPSAGMGDSRSQLPFPEGSNDVLEVLCSGEPTAGKLLMHFLLFYGQHFESMATSVDVSGVHHPDFPRYRNLPYGSYHLSSFVPRQAGGSIDPVTGMYTVDPIVIYDPLEGCENNNVARSCFAWASIRSVFHQCYMTLSGAVERGSGTGDGGAGLGRRGTGGNKSRSSNESARATQQGNWGQGPTSTSEDSSQQQVESVLALLLSF